MLQDMTLSKPVCRALALVVTVAFFLMATRTDIYNATSPRGLSRDLFGPQVLQLAHPWWLSLHIWVRKAYSIVAFAAVGFSIQCALRPAVRPALRAAVIVGIYSLGIEIVQRLFVTVEPVMESVLDVGCGALGGWLSISLIRLFHLRPDRSPPPESQRVGKDTRFEVPQCTVCAGFDSHIDGGGIPARANNTLPLL
jgi:hypothetical protein